jgi:hypothetical protein
MFDINKSHDANKSAEALKYYVRSIALLGEMKRDGSHHRGAEYAYLKSCFMKPTATSASDIMPSGESPNSPRRGNLGL